MAVPTNPDCSFCITKAIVLYSATGAASSFKKIPAVKQVDFRLEREEPNRVRHSDSGGQKVAPCLTESTNWFLDVLTELCDDDWLWAHLDPLDLSTSLFWRIYANSADAEGVGPTKRWALEGTTVMNNFGLNNDSDDNSEGSFTIEATSDITWPTGWTADTTIIE